MAGRWKFALVALLAAFVASAATLFIGFRGTLLALAVVASVLFLCDVDALAATFVCWAIGRIPQRYRWTIAKIKVRPTWFERDGGWSEITVVDWTWHNAFGFDDGLGESAAAFLLQIDELRFRLKLSSIWAAVREHRSVEVLSLSAHGVRFNASRNSRGALNLWRNLDLPDDDVNVRCFTSQACRYGGLCGEVGEDRGPTAVVPLPPISTATTRKASGFWKPEWGPKPEVDESGGSRQTSGDDAATPSSASEGKRRYVEEPIGDKRRRPRWGVPLRFDIHEVRFSDVQLWVLDLLTLDAHRTSRALARDTARIDIHGLEISRERLEADDPRRAGSVDGVRGVYLGELVWVLVAELMPQVVKSAPRACSVTVAVATGLAIKDATVRLGAKTVEVAHQVGHSIKEALHLSDIPQPGRTAVDGSRVHLRLLRGRQVTWRGRGVNCHAFVELLSSTGVVLAVARSKPQMWTKVPRWCQSFELGPATSMSDVVRITLYHQKSRQVVGITRRSKEMPERYIGEVTVPLRALLIRDAVIGEDGDIVGWFELTDARGLRKDSPCSGEVKLGFRVVGAELLAAGNKDCGGSDSSIL